ncbi:hypothetical protein [Litchfieldia salsa]|uniref:Intein N-terminal splicing region n=1 Tax=Litchfieldia salsa TaxID=930152 RepID=A0A1H0WZZ8_9BACI|nr:hypothetical protein [Litchfieldia salsa]SDP96277.1 intein N-terminal splicing region [Litchfieldia salsa]
MKKILLLVCISMIVIVGCNTGEEKVLTEAQGIADEIVENNENADIFMFNDSVYEKVSSNGDVEKTAEEKIGEIQEQYSPGETFQNGMATILSIGTEIYATSLGIGNDFLIVNIGGEWLKYEALPQG